jgi:hypothetical protein
MTSVPTPDELIAAFPNETIPKIEGRPDYESLDSIRKALRENAASVPSTLGGGAFGHVGLVVPDEYYAILAPNEPYEPPDNPGAFPDFPAGSTAAQISATERIHKEQMRIYREYLNIETALKSQLIKCIDPIYLHAKRNRIVGFANQSIKSILQYLFDTYGMVTAQDLDKNLEQLRKPWNPETPFETIIDQIDECQEYASSANQAYPPSMILNQAYNLVFNTGLYFDECKDWNRKPAVEKTWPNFQAHILEAQTTLRAMQSTGTVSGFANSMQQTIDDSISRILQPLLIQYQENITSPPVENAPNLSEDQKAFASFSADMTAQLKQAKDELEKLRNQLENKKPDSNQRKPARNFKDYCYTHGFYVGDGHTSQSCKTPCEGHKKDATGNNRMGGSERGTKQRDAWITNNGK